MIRDEQAAHLRLYTLGRFSVERRSVPSLNVWEPLLHTELHYKRVQELLLCLVSAPGRQLTRDHLLTLFWPELDVDDASHRLDRTIHSLRQIFKQLAPAQLLRTERSTLTLADQNQLWIDADAFELLAAQAQSAPDVGLAERLLEAASHLYTGGFLEETQIALVEDRRRSLHERWVQLMLELVDLRVSQQAESSAVELLYRVLVADPTNEEAIERLVTLFAPIGRPDTNRAVSRRLTAQIQQNLAMVPRFAAHTASPCGYCHAPLLPLDPDELDFSNIANDFTIRRRCSRCRVLYEFNYHLFQIVALSPDGDMLEQMRYCDRCQQLYRDGEPHTCPEDEAS